MKRVRDCYVVYMDDDSYRLMEVVVAKELKTSSVVDVKVYGSKGTGNARLNKDGLLTINYHHKTNSYYFPRVRLISDFYYSKEDAEKVVSCKNRELDIEKIDKKIGDMVRTIDMDRRLLESAERGVIHALALIDARKEVLSENNNELDTLRKKYEELRK